MAGKVLPDTNIVIAFWAGESIVVQGFAQHDIVLSLTVLGELYYGAAKSERKERNLQRLEGFVADNSLLDIDQETAHLFGEIQFALRVKGKMIPENDIWIAATAMQHGLMLITRDKHFNEVDGLIVERW